MTNNPTIDRVSRERSADSLYLTMWPNDTLHECERGNPKYEACLKAVDAGYAKGASAVERQQPVTAEYFEVVAEMRQQSLTRAWGKIRTLRDENKQLQARIAELEHGRGEPVAWMYKREGGEVLGQLVQMESDDLKCIRLGKCHDDGTRYMWPREDYIEWKPLYAAPPAPVAVVLPTTEQFKDAFRATGHVTHEQAWELAEAAEACLDATAALNEKPTNEVTE